MLILEIKVTWSNMQEAIQVKLWGENLAGNPVSQ